MWAGRQTLASPTASQSGQAGALLMWLDVRDATNRPVPFWVRSEAGPTSWWEPGGPNSSARLTGAVVVVCGA